MVMGSIPMATIEIRVTGAEKNYALRLKGARSWKQVLQKGLTQMYDPLYIGKKVDMAFYSLGAELPDSMSDMISSFRAAFMYAMRLKDDDREHYLTYIVEAAANPRGSETHPRPAEGLDSAGSHPK